jgi:archaellum biogenesis ATPase FlaH
MNIKHNLDALEVPPLFYDWSVDQMKSSKAKETTTKMASGIDKAIKNGGIIIITVDDALLASRLGVTLLKAALLKDYIKVCYLTPERIKGLKIDSFTGGDLYKEYVQSDLCVIDGVTPNVGSSRFQTYLEFLEERMLYKKCTVIVSTENTSQIFDEKALSYLNSVMKFEITQEML